MTAKKKVTKKSAAKRKSVLATSRVTPTELKKLREIAGKHTDAGEVSVLIRKALNCYLATLGEALEINLKQM